MKIRQTIRHHAAKASLRMPLVGDKVRAKLVDLHVEHFLERAPGDRRGERRERLEAFFDATMDAYLAALDAGLEEAKAREVTHVQANLEFLRMGWTEMMELPPEELDAHLDRYRAFFQTHGITREAPLGRFAPAEGLPEAPRTPERLEDPKTPYAEPGYEDATYVEDEEGRLREHG